MARYGCYVTSIAMLEGIQPDVLLDILNKGNAFNNQGALLNVRAADLLNRSYERSFMPEGMCIAETNFYINRVFSQHFFLWLNDRNKIVDPLTGTRKNNNYKIVSYRIFR